MSQSITQQMIMAFVLGLAGGITPGPVLAATFTEILQAGFYKSLKIILWALCAETVVALASLMALSSLQLPAAFFSVLSFIGAGVLAWIAVRLWKIRTLDSGRRVHFGFGKLSAMVFANGILWTYWITVCVPQAIMLGKQVAYGEYLFLMLVQIGWLLSTAGLAVIFSRFRSLLSSPHAIPVTFKFFSVVFLYFALNMVYTSAVSLAAR